MELEFFIVTSTLNISYHPIKTSTPSILYLSKTLHLCSYINLHYSSKQVLGFPLLLCLIEFWLVSANPTDNVISCYMGLELDARASLVFGLGPSGDGSDGDLGLTVTQLGLIERLRKAVLVIDKTKRVVKQVKENFLRVNNGMRDGVMPAEEGEAVLAVYFEQIGKFLGGNLVEHPRVKGERESAHGPS
jgi:hypothetical protein